MIRATVPHWRAGEADIEIAISRRGRRAALDPWTVLLRPSDASWPPPELTQKCYASRQREAFAIADQDQLSRQLGYYCDLQSLASEDALTWNVFGPLVYGAPEMRTAYVRDLCSAIGIGVPPDSIAPAMWLWRRVPHPENHAPGGPEVDVGVHAGPVLLLKEAKWLSRVGRRQGVRGDRDQIELREMFCSGLGQRLYPSVTHFVIMELGRHENAASNRTVEVTGRSVTFCSVAWHTIATLASHPLAAELDRHLKWKEEYGVARVQTGEPKAMTTAAQGQANP
jgi:hypothetical protein